MGRKKRPFYQIVVADSRSPRDGRFIERLGTYNPMTKPATIEIDRDKALQWVLNGAQPTETVRAILRFKGVFFKKHLLRGVKKGAMTIEEAEQKHQEWVGSKEARISARFEKTAEEKAAFHAAVSGKPVPAKPAPAPVVEAAPAPEVEEAEEIVAAVEETAVEETTAAETTVETEETSAPEAEEASAEDSTEE